MPLSNNGRIFLSPPHMSGEEMKYIQEAFDSNYIAPLGPQVDAFEAEFSEKVGISNVVALSSGTAAMHLALRNLDIKPEDEVFASTLTFIGSVSPVVFEGATPVFIDAERTSWNMDPVLLASELKKCHKNGKLPKAVVPTDLYGQCADYDQILKICKPYGIPVIVDSAEALGAGYCKMESNTWKHAGVGAKAAVFSFNGNKIITTSGGGMLASDDQEFIEQARKLSQQARESLPYYEHIEIGYNYRMSNILAAIGRGQLRVLEERVNRKREIFEYYQKALGHLPGINFMPEPAYSRSNRWLTVVLIDKDQFGASPEEVRLALEDANIESRPVWKPMHMQPVFNPHITQIDADYKKETNRDGKKRRYKARVVGGEVAEDLFTKGLCLPSGTAMTEGDLERVVSVIVGY